MNTQFKKLLLNKIITHKCMKKKGHTPKCCLWVTGLFLCFITFSKWSTISIYYYYCKEKNNTHIL